VSSAAGDDEDGEDEAAGGGGGEGRVGPAGYVPSPYPYRVSVSPIEDGGLSPGSEAKELRRRLSALRRLRRRMKGDMRILSHEIRVLEERL
jgi:hypothetical protein